MSSAKIATRIRRAAIAAAAAGVLALGAAAQEARGKLAFEPAAAEVGEPVRASLSLEHAKAERPALVSLGLDDSWLVLESKAGLDASDPAHPDRVTTTWVFEIASLEPGERTLANVPLKLGEKTVPVDAAPLAVRGVLGLDEDAPRELRGLRDIEAAGEKASSWPLLVAAAALACAAAITVFFLLRRKPAAAAAPAPSVRLALLEAKPLDTPEEVQAAHFALTRLLRESADLRAGRDLSGLTDEEWRAASSAELDAAGFAAGERELLERLLADASRVKYGPERPTHWATREALARARELAARFEAPRGAQAAAERKREVAA